MTQIYQYKLLYKLIIQFYYRFVKRFLRFSYTFLLIFSIYLKGAPRLSSPCVKALSATTHPQLPCAKALSATPPPHGSLVQRELAAEWQTEGLSCLFSVPKTLFDRGRYLTNNFPIQKSAENFPRFLLYVFSPEIAFRNGKHHFIARHPIVYAKSSPSFYQIPSPINIKTERNSSAAFGK